MNTYSIPCRNATPYRLCYIVVGIDGCHIAFFERSHIAEHKYLYNVIVLDLASLNLKNTSFIDNVDLVKKANEIYIDNEYLVIASITNAEQGYIFKVLVFKLDNLKLIKRLEHKLSDRRYIIFVSRYIVLVGSQPNAYANVYVIDQGEFEGYLWCELTNLYAYLDYAAIRCDTSSQHILYLLYKPPATSYGLSFHISQIEAKYTILRIVNNNLYAVMVLYIKALKSYEICVYDIMKQRSITCIQTMNVYTSYSEAHRLISTFYNYVVISLIKYNKLSINILDLEKRKVLNIDHEFSSNIISKMSYVIGSYVLIALDKGNKYELHLYKLTPITHQFLEKTLTLCITKYRTKYITKKITIHKTLHETSVLRYTKTLIKPNTIRITKTIIEIRTRTLTKMCTLTRLRVTTVTITKEETVSKPLPLTKTVTSYKTMTRTIAKHIPTTSIKIIKKNIVERSQFPESLSLLTGIAIGSTLSSIIILIKRSRT